MKKIVIIIALLVLVLAFLSQVFSGRIVLLQFFSIGPVTVHYYGLFMVAAVAGGFYLAKKRQPFFGIKDKEADSILFWAIIGGFVGSRLYHVLSSWEYYASHFIDIFKVWNGGLSVYGAVFGGVVSLLCLKKIFHLKSSILNLLNWLAPSVLLGQIIGRFGNLFNYELYGYPTGLPWKMFVPADFRPVEFLSSKFFHPLFLYEQVGMVLILWFVLRRKSHPEPVAPLRYRASLFVWYVLLYNTLRFGLEFLRIDAVFVLGMRQNAIVSLALVLVGAGMLIKNTTRHKA